MTTDKHSVAGDAASVQGLSPSKTALTAWWLNPTPAPSPASADGIKDFDKTAEDIRKGQEAAAEAARINLETQKLKVFGRAPSRNAGAPLIGAEGVSLFTDYDLRSLPPQRWQIKNVIPDAGIGIIYGDSGTFKSFIALDMMAAIATGQPKWFGYRVQAAPCIYVPLEGKGGIPKRVEAWQLMRSMQMTVPHSGNLGMLYDFSACTGIVFVTTPLNLRTTEDRGKLVEALTTNELNGGHLCIDTLAQAGGGIDENTSEGMGELIRIMQDLQDKLGGVVTALHHTGKDASRGMRGHSSLRGAIDFAIECSRPNGDDRFSGQMRLDKVKDEEAGQVIPFAMQRITLGVDDDGDLITSLVVVSPDLPGTDFPLTTPDEPVTNIQAATDNAETDDFVWNWIKHQREALDKYPSLRSLSGQFREMMEGSHIRRREHVRDSVARLIASKRVQEEKGGTRGQKWLRAMEVMHEPPRPPAPLEALPQQGVP